MKAQNMQRRLMNLQSHLESILPLIVISGLTFVIYTILGIWGFIVLILSLLLASFLLYIRWKRFRGKGIISCFGQKTRAILLQRSVLDVFRDIVYFPYVTKIISAIITILTNRPHPDCISQIVALLPQQVQQISTKKGLLSLAPQTIQSLVLPDGNKQLLPVQYGKNDIQWDRKEEYHKGNELVHQQSLQMRVVEFLDDKFGWMTILVLMGGVVVGAQQMKHRNFKRMLVRSGTFCCLILSLTVLTIKLRRNYDKKRKKTVQLSKNSEEIIKQ